MHIASGLRHDTIQVSKRQLMYLLLTFGLLLAYWLMQDIQWQGSTELHTIMAAIAALLAFMVGVIALIRYYTRKSHTFFYIGVGFIGTCLLETYNAVVTSDWITQVWTTAPPHIIPWSWMASRMFLATFLFLSWYAWYKEEQHKHDPIQTKHEFRMYIAVELIILACFILLAFYPLPSVYAKEFIFGRPGEYVPAAIFLCALMGYLIKGKWKKYSFEHWLVMSLIINLIAQTIFVSFSIQLFDLQFNGGYLLKLISYIFVLIGLLFDIHYVFVDAEKQREAARHLDTIKSEFVSLASHQLRTPLACVRWALAALGEGDVGDLNEEQKEIVEGARIEGARMAEIISTLLQLSRIEAGKVQSNAQTVVLCDVLKEVEHIYKKRIDEKHLHLMTECSPDIKVYTDPDILKEIIDNLLSNAIKYTEAKGRVTIKAAVTNDNKLSVEVSDNGYGIPKEQQERIFTKFFRGDNIRKKGTSGTGLGLYLVYSLVQLVEGTISFTSEENTGTTFSLILPNLPKA